MPHEVEVRACAECGWPALAGTRRCPYCRTTMTVSLRARVAGWPARHRVTDPFYLLALAYSIAMVLAFTVALATLGIPFAGLVALIAISPGVFLFALRRRTIARMRSLSARARRPRLPTPPLAGPPPAEPHNTSTDGGLR